MKIVRDGKEYEAEKSEKEKKHAKKRENEYSKKS